MAGLTDGDRAELREMCEEKWVACGLAQDWGAAMALCTDDLVYMPQDHPALMGREAAQGYLEGFPEMTAFTQQLIELFGDTELAVMRATFGGSFMVDGQRVTGVGKALATATKRSGSWRFSRVCFNWDEPPAPVE